MATIDAIDVRGFNHFNNDGRARALDRRSVSYKLQPSKQLVTPGLVLADDRL
jgi:hypothetical protein